MLDRLRIRGGLALAVALLALVVTGCGETVIDSEKTADTIRHNLEKAGAGKISKVDCPSDVPVEKGKTFSCTVTMSGGKTQTAKLKIINDNADLTLVDFSPNK